MSVAITLVSALLIVGLTITEASRRAQRRQDAVRGDPSALLAGALDTPNRTRSGGAVPSALLGGMIALIITYQLALRPGVAHGRLTLLGMIAAAIAGAVHLLTLVQWRWDAEARGRCGTRPDVEIGPGGSVVIAGIGFFLITLAAILFFTFWMIRHPLGLAERVHAAALFGFATMTGHWTWLTRVWQQQLDHGRAWTTSGRLIATGRTLSVVCAALGLLAGLAVRLGPQLWWTSSEVRLPVSSWAAFGGHGLLLTSCLWCRRAGGPGWRRTAFLVIAVLVALNALRLAGYP